MSRLRGGMAVGLWALAACRPATDPPVPPGVAAEPKPAAESTQPVTDDAGPPEHDEGAESPTGERPPLAPAPAEIEAITGIDACDRYLSLYERCGAILEPEIMAGDRRPVHAEKGWVEHMASTPEKAALPQACEQWLSELQPRCSGPAADRRGP